MPDSLTQLDAADVVAFLRENPGFLAEHPALYRRLDPPARVHGEALSDHMAAMLRAERAHAAAMQGRADDVLAAGRAAAGMTALVQEAVLAMIRAPDAIDCIVQEFSILLAVDAVTLCVEGDLPGTNRVPPGTVARCLAGRAVVFGDGNADAALLHGEAAHLARHAALVAIPGRGPAALLALADRDGATLDPCQGSYALGFLGRAVAAALGRD